MVMLGREHRREYTKHSQRFSQYKIIDCIFFLGFPGVSDGKESTSNAGDLGLVLGWEDPLEEGMATHFSIPAWGILMDRGAWQFSS